MYESLCSLWIISKTLTVAWFLLRRHTPTPRRYRSETATAAAAGPTRAGILYHGKWCKMLCCLLRALQCSAVTQSEKHVWQHAPGPRVTDKLRALWKWFISQGFCCSLVFFVISHPKGSYSESLSWFQSTGRDPRSEKHVTEFVALRNAKLVLLLQLLRDLFCLVRQGLSVSQAGAGLMVPVPQPFQRCVPPCLPLQVFSVSLRCGRRTHSWYLIHHMTQNIFSVLTVFRDHQLFLNFKHFNHVAPRSLPASHRSTLSSMCLLAFVCLPLGDTCSGISLLFAVEACVESSVPFLQ